jgi:hypothetical protein
MTTSHPALACLERLLLRLEAGLLTLEARLGRGGAAAALALVTLALAAAWARPSLTPINHGAMYARLADAPLAFEEDNWVQYRILTPLVAHALHLRGQAYLLLPPIVLLALLASVYLHYRRRGWSAPTAAGLMAALAFSMPVLFPLHASGYVDPTSTLLLFWCFALPGRPAVQGLLFGLAVFNHESALAAAPWLLLTPRRDERPVSRLLVFLGVAAVALGAYAAWRGYVAEHVAVRFTSDFYLRPERILKNLARVEAIAPLGAFLAFRLLWFFPLGALVDGWLERRWRSVLWLLAVLLGAASQILLAHDVSRLMGLAFPAVLYGCEAFGERYGEERLTRWLWALVLLNFLVPAYDLTPAGLVPLLPYWWPSFG